MDTFKVPAFGQTDFCYQRFNVVIGKGVTEGFFGTVKKILAVNIGKGAFYRWFNDHGNPL